MAKKVEQLNLTWTASDDRPPMWKRLLKALGDNIGKTVLVTIITVVATAAGALIANHFFENQAAKRDRIEKARAILQTEVRDLGRILFGRIQDARTLLNYLDYGATFSIIDGKKTQYDDSVRRFNEQLISRNLLIGDVLPGEQALAINRTISDNILVCALTPAHRAISQYYFCQNSLWVMRARDDAVSPAERVRASILSCESRQEYRPFNSARADKFVEARDDPRYMSPPGRPRSRKALKRGFPEVVQQCEWRNGR